MCVLYYVALFNLDLFFLSLNILILIIINFYILSLFLFIVLLGHQLIFLENQTKNMGSFREAIIIVSV